MIRLDKEEIVEIFLHTRPKPRIPIINAVVIDGDKNGNLVSAAGIAEKIPIWNSAYLNSCVEEVAILLVREFFPEEGRQWTTVVKGEYIPKNIPAISHGKLFIYVDLERRTPSCFFLNGKMKDSYGRTVMEVKNLQIV